MSHNLTDARDIIFAEPADMDTPSGFETMSLDDQIAYAEWQLEVALADLDKAIDDADFDHAAFGLKVAMERMNGLIAQRDARDAEIEKRYAEQLELAFGEVAIVSDKFDKAIAEGGF